MNFLKKIFIIIFLSIASPQILIAETPYFLDFKFILNESIAGKKAQAFLKNNENPFVTDFTVLAGDLNEIHITLPLPKDSARLGRQPLQAYTHSLVDRVRDIRTTAVY